MTFADDDASVIQPGMLIRSPIDAALRVLWVDPRRDAVIYIDTNGSTAMPEAMPLSEIHLWLAQDLDVLLETHPTPVPLRLDDLTDAEQAYHARAAAVIKAADDHEPAIYHRRKRGELVRAICHEMHLSKPSVYRYLRQYWQNGKQIASLLPGFAACGAPGRGRARTEDQSHGRPKRGRPRDPELGYVGRNVTTEDIHNIQISCSKAYNSKNEERFKSAYVHFLITFCSKDVRIAKTGNDPTHVDPIDPDRIISFDQFCYHARAQEDRQRLQVLRRGQKDFDRNLRSLLSHNLQDVHGPGARYEIDATVLDVMLRSTHDPNWAVGRVTFYIVIDVFSRMIAGYYLTFEPPNWRAAAMALLHAGTNKVAACARFGVSIEPDDWPVAELPKTLLTDNGEFRSRLAEVLPRFGLCDVENAPVGRPDLKGLVERTFRTLTAEVVDYVPGAIMKNLSIEHRKQKPQDDLCLNMHELNRFVINRILDHNHRIRKSYPLTPEQISDGVAASPIQLWNWGERNLYTESRRFDETYLRLHLLPSEQATVDRSGVRLFGGLLYSGEELHAERWFQNLQQDRGKLEVAYHPGDMTTVKVKHPTDRTRWYDCSLTSHSQMFQGRSLSEIFAIRKQGRLVNQRAAVENLPRELGFASDAYEVIDNARNRHLAYRDPHVTSSERAKQQAPQRRLDAEATLRDEADALGLVVTPVKTPSQFNRLTVDRYEQDMAHLEGLENQLHKGIVE